jgi:hypothetical protein
LGQRCRRFFLFFFFGFFGFISFSFFSVEWRESTVESKYAVENRMCFGIVQQFGSQSVLIGRSATPNDADITSPVQRHNLTTSSNLLLTSRPRRKLISKIQ